MKIKRYAFSGGRETIKEHREKGGNPDVDVSYQYLRMFFEPDDKKLKQIYDDYKSGKLLTGELKEILIEKINSFLKEEVYKGEEEKESNESEKHPLTTATDVSWFILEEFGTTPIGKTIESFLITMLFS